MTNIQSIASECVGDWGDVKAISLIEFGQQRAMRARPDCIPQNLRTIKQVVSGRGQQGVRHIVKVGSKTPI